MKNFSTFVLIAICLASPQLANAGRPDWQQCGKANKKSIPCPVSVYTLVATPEVYDGIYVQFIAHYPSPNSLVIYANEDAAIQSDFMSSILLDATQELTCGYYQVTGLFRHDTRDSGVASGIYWQRGRIYDVDMSRPMHGLNRRCADYFKGVEYLDGVVPIKRMN